ncbi:PREDICTED: uncharacterized protein LOC107097209 isoform X1 [Cyprinodon variegatus]|uniref:uncharacterized protein LOC107097209 isoform X1 n=1 Tax=Cyprinodon variegatus TaxID=28743 RepID=UPI0007424F75|nr:PREDICTED: uncharacterized protein LOC107097209 isoform X1 [Cyprinodon variegatus]
MPRGSEIPEGIRSIAVDLHKAGKGYKFISKTLEIPPSTVRSIIVKWKRFNTVATLPRSGRPTKAGKVPRLNLRNLVSFSKGNPKRKQKGQLDEDDPTSDKDEDPDEPNDISEASGAASNADSKASVTEPSKEGRGSSRSTLLTGDEEMRDGNSSNQEGGNTRQSESDEEDPMTSFQFARSAAEDEDHKRVEPPGRASDREDSEKTPKNFSIIDEDGDEAEPSDTDEEDPLANYLFARAKGGTGKSSHHEKQKRSTSGDETSEEDPMEQIFDPKFDGEKKIYSGSSVSVRALLLLLLTFVLKHDLSKAATKDLLALLNLMVPGCIPSSLRFLKKHLTEIDKKTELHLYCPRCENYLGIEPGTECGVCQQRLSKKSLLEKANYFLVMPLEIQLRKVLTRIHSKLGKHFTRQNFVSDINTGGEYRHDEQEGSITLTFTCDGAPLLNSSKFSVWPILCTINELPYVERCKNVLLHTLWFGKGKPLLQCFFTPFINELHKLSHEGFTWEDESGLELNTRVTAKICVCDSLARSAVQNFQPFSSEFGCGFCYHKGELVQKGRGYTRVYPVQADGCDLRHMAETEQLASLVVQNEYPQGQMGVKGHSPLLLLPSFDVIKGFIPDYMHCVCLGVVPEFVNLWLDPLYARKPFHLPAQSLKDLDEALCGIQPPDEIRPRPRGLSDRMHWEASEWRAFALLYSPVVLRKVLANVYYKHWMLLISSLHILLSKFASQEEISFAEVCLLQFVTEVPSLYGLEHCSFNCHLLVHLPDCARNWGLLWANSAFVFHDVQSRLLQTYSRTQSASPLIFKQFVSFNEIVRKGKDVLKDAGAEITSLFSSMTSCGSLTKSSNHIGEDVFTLGCGSQRSLTARELATLPNKDTWPTTEYTCFVSRGMLVTTLDHSVSCKRNNSVIETTSGFGVVESAVVIEKDCSCDKSSSCSCRELVVFCRKLLPANSQPTILNTQINRNIAEFLVRVRSSDELFVVTCQSIISKCFVMQQKGGLYLMRLPVLNTL